MDKSNIKHGIAGVLIIGLIFSYEYYQSYKLKEDHNYTIGEVYKFEQGSRGGKYIHYRFEVNNKVFTGKTLSKFDKQKRISLLNKYFFVYFNPDKPKNNWIYLEKTVDKNKYDIPPQGWRERPSECPDIN